MKKFIVIIFIILFITNSLYSQNLAKRIAAVLDLQGNGVSKAEAGAITNLLITSIYETDLLDVIDRNQRELILSEITFSLSGCADDSCAIEVGKLLAADVMITGTIDQIGSRLSIDLKALDVASSKIIGTYNKMFESIDAIVNSVDNIGGQFVQNFTGQLAAKKAVLKYEELVPLTIKCAVEDAMVLIDGAAIGKIENGTITKAININAEIELVIKAEGYYESNEIIDMEAEKTVEVELEPLIEHRFGLQACFGNGLMGSLAVMIFPNPNWWYINIGAGLTVVSTSPILINLPVFIKSGSYIGLDDRSRIRPYLGGLIMYDLATVYESTFLFKSPGLINYSLTAGPYGGVEFKLTEHIRISAEASLLLNALFAGDNKLIQMGFGFSFM